MRKLFIISMASMMYFAVFYVNTVSADEKSALYKEIEQYKQVNDKEAIDARCDSVFKLIPGIYGKNIDVSKSYELMKEEGVFNKNKVAYKTVKGKSVDDLECGPVYKANENKESISLIINVAWGEHIVPEMLEILDKLEVKANFFLEGRWAMNNLDMVFDIHMRGHLLGNHSYTHADFAKISKEKAFEEIHKTNQVIEAITNDKVKYFGPPSGSFKQDTIDLVNTLKMKTIMWSLDTIDWQRPSVETIKERIIPKLHKGAIILMHPTENTRDALEDIIKAALGKNLAIETLDRLMY